LDYAVAQMPHNGIQSINGLGVPQIASPKSFAELLTLLFATDIVNLKFSLLSGDPIVFGSPEVISVTNLVPTSAPEPMHLELSIVRGQTKYATLYTGCYAGAGSGGIGPGLKSSSLNFAQMSSFVNSNMLFRNASACRDMDTATSATDVANFILNVFEQ
jgi:hypothetical protein